MGVEKLNKKEKGLMDMDNSVVTEWGGIGELNGNGKNNLSGKKKNMLM